MDEVMAKLSGTTLAAYSTVSDKPIGFGILKSSISKMAIAMLKGMPVMKPHLRIFSTALFVLPAGHRTYCGRIIADQEYAQYFRDAVAFEKAREAVSQPDACQLRHSCQPLPGPLQVLTVTGIGEQDTVALVDLLPAPEVGAGFVWKTTLILSTRIGEAMSITAQVSRVVSEQLRNSGSTKPISA